LEAFTNYKSFTPKYQTLPNIANPPDSTRRAVLTNEVSTKCRENISNICNDASTNSMPNYSLLTLYSTGHENLPKCHVAFKVSPAVLTNCNVLNFIPSGLNFIYEILLLEDYFTEYEKSLPSMISWLQQRKAIYLITVPEKYGNDLINATSINLEETVRPFLEDQSAYSIT
jgi:hypothetical protein